jgi:succinoglycan biosynthesis transport protein ExoP
MDARTNDLPPATEFADGWRSTVSDARPSIGVADIYETLRRAWRWPLYGLLIGLVLATVAYLLIPTPYKSSARIIVDRSVNRYLQNNRIADQPTFDEGEIGSQVYVLSSDSVIIPVVRALGLAHDREFVGLPKMGGARISEYVDDLKRLALKSVGANTGETNDQEAALERTAAEAVAKRLTVTREDVANVINVAFESEDKFKAASIANAIADTYIAVSMDAKLQSTKVASQWLQERLVELKKQVADADKALEEFRTANNLKSGAGGANAELRASLNTQLTNAQIATAEAKSRLERIQKGSLDDVTSISGADALNNPARSGVINFALNNSDLVKLRSQYRDATTKLAEVAARVGNQHEIPVKLRRQADDLKNAIQTEERRIADAYANEYQVAAAREAELASSAAKLFGGSDATSELRELESTAETLRNLYNNTLQKFKETNTIETGSVPVQSARVISRAAPPLAKNSKKALAIMAGSLALCFFFGTGAAIGREWISDVLRTPRAVEQVTGRKCVVLPLVEAKSGPIEEYVLEAPYSRFTEAMRGTKALIDANRIVHGAKVIGVVSAVPNEGKTTVGANLASLMVAATGARTLLIDSDFHVRKLSATMAPGAQQGLLEALQDPARLSWFVSRRPHSNVHVLPCVSPARIPNSAELLGSPEMAQLLAVARKSYDCIVIEIAPILSVVDIKMIERFVDQFVFVLQWGETKRNVLLNALSDAEIICDRIAGVVLNKADPVALKHAEALNGIRPGSYYQD